MLRNLGWALGATLLVGCVRPEREEKGKEKEGARPQPSSALAQAPAPGSSSALASPPPAPPVVPGKIDSIVEVSGEELLGRVRASKAKGTVVNAWASWCGPCKEEFPMLVRMKQALGARGIEVVFVSVDEPETQEAARAFAAEHGLSGELLVATRPLGPFKKSMNPEWPGMLPATFLFDASARLRHFWGGPVFEDELMPVIEGFLAGKDIDGKSLPGLSPGLDFRE